MEWNDFKKEYCQTKCGIFIDTIRLNKTIFFKEFNENNQLLDDLNTELIKNPNNDKIKNDIMFLKQGLRGEKAVAFELKNSGIPMVVLHDIRLEFDGNVAQFDYILITEDSIYSIECKNLSGNIEITKNGDFIRTVYYGKSFHKEGMYSPITQNERHLKLLKNILLKNKIIETYPVKSIVVMSNEKTIINSKYAPKDIKESVIKIDQVINSIKNNDLIERKKFGSYRNPKFILKIANFLLENDKHIKYDLRKKYCLDETSEEEQIKTQNNTEKYDLLYTELKKYRLAKSKEENIAPYMVFNNDELESLIKQNPKDLNDILKVKGFGQVKVNKYGAEILKIFQNNLNIL